MDLIGHLGQKSFIDAKGLTNYFLYKGLDKVFSTKCGKGRELGTGDEGTRGEGQSGKVTKWHRA
jgi:hypothetical protein